MLVTFGRKVTKIRSRHKTKKDRDTGDPLGNPHLLQADLYLDGNSCAVAQRGSIPNCCFVTLPDLRQYSQCGMNLRLNINAIADPLNAL